MMNRHISKDVRKLAQKGFTLIELMIVVAIVGVLAAIAIPAYSDFMVRSRLTEVLGAIGACKLSATDFYLENNGWNSIRTGANISTLNLCNSPGSRYVVPAGVTINPQGTILAATQNMGAGVVDGQVLTMRPVLQGNEIRGWICGDPADGSTFESRHKPGSCQG